MSEFFTTDGIDRLQAQPDGAPDGGWRVSFRSVHEGRHHQLYANGVLADWTDSPDERAFRVDPPAGPVELVVAAVERGLRATDLSDHLDTSQRERGWVFRVDVVRDPNQPRDAELLLRGDRATGTLCETPLARQRLWDERLPRWGWGEDRFGRGAFGLDAAAAPGFGRGAFAAGPFGTGQDAVALAAALSETGTHQLCVRSQTPAGLLADGAVLSFQAAPPPPPPNFVIVTSYDPATHALTLQFE